MASDALLPLQESPVLEQRLNDGFLTAELQVEFHRIFGATPFQHIAAEGFGHCRIEDIAGFLEGFKGIGVEHFRPGIGIVAARITP